MINLMINLIIGFFRFELINIKINNNVMRKWGVGVLGNWGGQVWFPQSYIDPFLHFPNFY